MREKCTNMKIALTSPRDQELVTCGVHPSLCNEEFQKSSVSSPSGAPTGEVPVQPGENRCNALALTWFWTPSWAKNTPKKPYTTTNMCFLHCNE